VSHRIGRDLPRLLVGEVDEHVGPDEEVGPLPLGHGPAGQLDEQAHLDAVPVGIQAVSVVVDELEGQGREGREGWLAHGVLPS
jgi:hypothetical protein